jgi:hypothetical protein
MELLLTGPTHGGIAEAQRKFARHAARMIVAVSACLRRACWHLTSE